MPKDPILLISGSGIIGGWTAKFLRASYPDLPLLIGGRDLAKAKQVASDIGNAVGVAVDLKLGNLGLEERPISAVAVFLKDDKIAGLRFAQTRGVPHIGISSGMHEIAPEVAAYIHLPNSAPVVLGGEWLVGATTIHALEFCQSIPPG